MFLYLMKTTNATASIASKPTIIALFTKLEPSVGEIVSSLTMSNWNGNEPVNNIVCNLFICA